MEKRIPDVAAALLAAAKAEVLAKGSVDVSLRAIARRVGVSHQAPGHFFGNRSGLLTALAAAETKRLGEHLEKTEKANAALPARERLSALGVAYIQFATEHRELFRLAARGEYIDRENADLTQARLDTWAVLVRAVADSQSAGWRSDQSLEDTALLCWTVVHGAAIAWADGLLETQFPTLSIEEIAIKVTDAL